MKWLKVISAIVMMAFVVPLSAAEAQEGEVDVAEMLFGHIGDSYGWHITDWNGSHVTIPLPCIVHSSTGWHVFMSSKVEHGHEYEGLFLAEEGRYEGKIVEQMADGTLARPFDISITKNVASLMFTALLLIALVLGAARWYRKHDAAEEGAPKGFAGLMEMMVMMVNDDLIKPSIGEHCYRKYAPYLLTVFFFIFLSNLLGIVPFFPGGANVTGNIAVTMVLALCTFFAINIFGNRHYWKEILWPDVPVFLKFPIPIMQTIELFGMISKPFSLMVRLFANIMAGHAMILGLVAVIFVTVKLGPVINGSMTVIAMLFGVFMDCLELLVAFIQAYVFTMLSAVFIGLSRQEESAHPVDPSEQGVTRT
ncbi:MAG: F0F1 ATP synthase subunit A [Bacteroidales bacterium]|nr:F0F1 ATP synthase subunit A [Bacteroidales bacterium]